jgi:hypothetical protein
MASTSGWRPTLTPGCLHALAQGVKHFRDIRYGPGVSYGEMFLQVVGRGGGGVQPTHSLPSPAPLP